MLFVELLKTFPRDQQPLVIALFLVVCTTMGIFVYVLSSKQAESRNKPIAFLTKDKQLVKLIEKRKLSRDTFLFKFQLPKNMKLGLPIGKHVKFFAANAKGRVQGEWNGNEDMELELEFERKYTPVLDEISARKGGDSVGAFDMVIKVYEPNDKFCDGGKMSRHFGGLKVGDCMAVSGPFGFITYAGNGMFKKSNKDVQAKEVGMMAGGTGITPMLQIIEIVLANPKDKTKLSLIFANQTEEDILLKDRLDDLAGKYANRFKVHYTLDRAPRVWQGSTGFITKEMIQEHLPKPSEQTVVLICGPPSMVKLACQQNLDSLGYAGDRQLVF